MGCNKVVTRLLIVQFFVCNPVYDIWDKSSVTIYNHWSEGASLMTQKKKEKVAQTPMVRKLKCFILTPDMKLLIVRILRWLENLIMTHYLAKENWPVTVPNEEFEFRFLQCCTMCGYWIVNANWEIANFIRQTSWWWENRKSRREGSYPPLQAVPIPRDSPL